MSRIINNDYFVLHKITIDTPNNIKHFMKTVLFYLFIVIKLLS